MTKKFYCQLFPQESGNNSLLFPPFFFFLNKRKDFHFKREVARHNRSLRKEPLKIQVHSHC